jgi:hypothetical protein
MTRDLKRAPPFAPMCSASSCLYRRALHLAHPRHPCRHTFDGASITSREKAMKPAKDTDQQTAQGSVQTKSTMLDLWRRHPEIQDAAMIETPVIPYVRVVYAFCGYPVTQQEFDAVLKALTRSQAVTIPRMTSRVWKLRLVQAIVCRDAIYRVRQLASAPRVRFCARRMLRPFHHFTFALYFHAQHVTIST